MIGSVLTPFIPYIAAAAVVAGGATAMWVQSRTIDTLEAKLKTETILHGACEARADNLMRDKETDREVDNLSNDDLRTVPPSWLVP